MKVSLLLVAGSFISVLALAKPNNGGSHYLTLSAKSGEHVEYCAAKDRLQDVKKGVKPKGDSDKEVVCQKGSLPVSDEKSAEPVKGK